MAIILDGDNGVTTPVISAGNIVGQVCFFALVTAPTGFLKCNGALVSRTTYADLFAVIGTTFGAGDGSTTFALPDLRGEFIRGWADGSGVDTGRTFGSSQGDAFQGHRHYGGSLSLISGSGTGMTSGTVNRVTRAETDGILDGDSGTPRTALETRPRNIALLACIKF